MFEVRNLGYFVFQFLWGGPNITGVGLEACMTTYGVFTILTYQGQDRAVCWVGCWTRFGDI